MQDARSRWHGRRVLVTGCTGFLGGSVVRELLAGGAEVVGLVRDRVADNEYVRHRLAGRIHAVRGRVEDGFRLYSALAVHEVAAVFHLAAADPNQPDRGTAAVVEAVRRYDARIPVVTARPADLPVPTAAPVPFGVARFGEVFGGGDRNTFRVVPATVVGLATGDRAHLPAAGSRRDFVAVGDAARALVRLADAVANRPEPHVADIAFRSGWELTDAEMAAAVRDVFDGRTPADPGQPPAEPLGWRPAEPFAVALAATIHWYREFVRTRFFGTIPAEPTRRAA